MVFSRIIAVLLSLVMVPGFFSQCSGADDAEFYESVLAEIIAMDETLLEGLQAADIEGFMEFAKPYIDEISQMTAFEIVALAQAIVEGFGIELTVADILALIGLLSEMEPLVAMYATEAAESQLIDDKAFPYIPDRFDPSEIFPSCFFFDGELDSNEDNVSLGNVSFFLDSEIFTQSDMFSDYDDFLVFESAESSDIGPCIISVLAEDIDSLIAVFENDDGTLDQVMTLNTAVELFLIEASLETYSYLSEMLGEHYVSGAMFSPGVAVGFIFYFMDQDMVYSLQFLSFDAENFSELHWELVSDIFNSVSFGNNAEITS